MKNLVSYMAVLCVCASIASAGFTYTLTGGFEYYDFNLKTNESLLVTGGGVNQVNVWYNSYAEIRNTSPLQHNFGGIDHLNMDDYGSLHYYGGETASLSMDDHSTAIIEGGSINALHSTHAIAGWDVHGDPFWDKHIEIKCKSYDYNTSTKLLTGVWKDDSLFSIQLYDDGPNYSTIDNIFFTPEPASLALFGLGGLLLRRQRK